MWLHAQEVWSKSNKDFGGLSMINRMKSEKTSKKFSYEKLVKNDAGLLASGPN